MEKPKKKKTLGEVKMTSKYFTKMSKDLAEFYDRTIMENLRQSLICSFDNRKIIGYRNVKTPRYLEINVPNFERHYDEDGNYEGLLVFTRKVRVCQVGTKIEGRPIYFKPKNEGSIIKFSRYGSLKPIGKTGKKYKVVKVKIR